MRLKAKTMDMTTGGVLRSIIMFSIPIFIGSLLQEMYTTVDTLVVGHTLGVDKLAAVGSTSGLVFLVSGFIMGCNNGCAVPTSHFIGAGDMRGVRRSIAAQIIICLLQSLLFTTIFTLIARPLLRLINTPENIFDAAYKYLLVIYLGLTATSMYNLLSSTLRSLGDSRTPLLFLIFSSLLNIGLDFLLILAFKWDVVGAAVATVFSQLVSVILCLIYALHRFSEFMPRKADLEGVWKQVGESLKMGIPMGLQSTMVSLGVVILAGVLNTFGSDAVAANSIGLRVQRIIEIVSISLTSGLTVFVGQNYGARRFDRIREGVRKLWLLDFIYMIIIPAIALLLRKHIVGLFVDDASAEMLSFFNVHLLCMCPLMWTLSFLHVYRSAVIGLGQGLAAFITGIPELIMRAALSLGLASVIGYAAVVLTGPASWIFSAIPILFVYSRKMKRESLASLPKE